MKKNHILVISILLFVSGFCSAAASKPVDLNDFKGTSWVIYGGDKFSGSKFATESAKEVGYIDFNDDGTFSITTDILSEDYPITGTYGVDSKGKLFIMVNVDGIESFFNNNYSPNFEYGYDFFDVQAPIAVKSTCKVTYSGSMVSLAITISVNAKVIIIYYTDDSGDIEKTYNGKISYTLSMSGDHPVAAGASNWASKWIINNAKATLSTKKAKASETMYLELTIGDFDSSGLGLNQYLLVDPNSVVFSSDVQSDFCRSKNTVYFSGAESDIDTIIQNLILENNSNVSDVEIDDDTYSPYSTVTATIKNGRTNTISLTGTIYFWVDITYTDDTEADNVKGTLKFSGKGVPAP
ncbi:MAG: hypothetical protein ABSF37_00880 [Sedimentisphaerales bacterium]|jgi:hypothetical protein